MSNMSNDKTFRHASQHRDYVHFNTTPVGYARPKRAWSDNRDGHRPKRIKPNYNIAIEELQKKVTQLTEMYECEASKVVRMRDAAKRLQEKKQEVEDTQRKIVEELKDARTQMSEARDKLFRIENVMESHLTCSICSEIFISATITNCNHTFCKYCLNKWLDQSNNCPDCRSKVVSTNKNLAVENFITSFLDSCSPERISSRLEEQQRRADEWIQTRQSTSNTTNITSTNNHARNNRRRDRRYSARTDLDEFDGPLDFEPIEDQGAPPLNENMFMPGNPNAYYGGYGHCFICGSIGHWANGCLQRRGRN